ncbi:hypothetical protein D7W09_05245 [bacterium D16-34]|nr:hypothetical protein D7W09_05245 [bacterium D16-34]
MASPLTQSAYGEAAQQPATESVEVDELVPLTNSFDQISLVDVGATTTPKSDESEDALANEPLDAPEEVVPDTQDPTQDSVLDEILSDEHAEEKPAVDATSAEAVQRLETPIASEQSVEADDHETSATGDVETDADETDEEDADVVAYADGTTDVVLQGITFRGVGISASDFEVSGNKVSIKTSK